MYEFQSIQNMLGIEIESEFEGILTDGKCIVIEKDEWRSTTHLRNPEKLPFPWIHLPYAKLGNPTSSGATAFHSQSSIFRAMPPRTGPAVPAASRRAKRVIESTSPSPSNHPEEAAEEDELDDEEDEEDDGMELDAEGEEYESEEEDVGAVTRFGGAFTIPLLLSSCPCTPSDK